MSQKKNLPKQAGRADDFQSHQTLCDGLSQPEQESQSDQTLQLPEDSIPDTDEATLRLNPGGKKGHHNLLRP